MSEIQHQPWVGSLFSVGPSRLLILGESHHGDDPEVVDMTIPVVDDWLLAVALSGQEPWQLDRGAVFQRIAFYNYVKRVMSGPRVAPTEEDFTQSEAAFREVIERLQPTHIAVCGDRLWRSLPAFDLPDPDGFHATLGDRSFHLGRYRTASTAPLAMCIRHPQSGFNGRTWYPRLQAFLAMGQL